MELYHGSKFYCRDEYKIKVDCWGSISKKPIFHMTSSYIKYLKELEREKKVLEVRTLREKLQYQFKVFGEVDNLDFNNYIKKAQELNKIN